MDRRPPHVESLLRRRHGEAHPAASGLSHTKLRGQSFPPRDNDDRSARTLKESGVEGKINRETQPLTPSLIITLHFPYPGPYCGTDRGLWDSSRDIEVAVIKSSDRESRGGRKTPVSKPDHRRRSKSAPVRFHTVQKHVAPSMN